MNVRKLVKKLINELNFSRGKVPRAPKNMKVKVEFSLVERGEHDMKYRWDPRKEPKGPQKLKQYEVQLFHGDDYQIGWVDLLETSDGSYETHSKLVNGYQNQGLGVLLYAKAIDFGLKKGFKIVSSTGTSSDAQRVWKSMRLNKLFKVKRNNKTGRFECLGRR